MVIVYTLVAAAFLYVARGWIVKLIFKREMQSEESCGTCASGACTSCKAHIFTNPKIV
jgi:hypothetical protein